MTRAELAKAINQHLWTATGRDCHITVDALRRYEYGQVSWPGAMYREAFRAVLGAETDADLGFVPTPRGRTAVRRNSAFQVGEARPSPATPPIPSSAWATTPLGLVAASYNHRAPQAEADAGPAAGEAARESWWHLATATAAIDPTGIETVHDEIVRLARQYDTLPPAKVLVDARGTRDLTYGLLEQTRRPAQLTSLNLDAGLSCALLAVASFDLGQPEASVAQARAAAKYADVIEHAGLKAWSTGHLSLVAYWSGNPRDAVRIADLALATAPDGTARARLHAVRARAWALIGDQHEVDDSLQRADEALASSDGTEEVHDEIGGEFAWGATRNAMCAGTALVTLGDVAEGAGRLRETIAAAPRTVSGHLVRRSRIDLATAELTAGRFDAAIDQLRYIWSTPVEQRRVGLTGRLDRVQNALGHPTWKKYQPANALKDQITVFTGEADDHRSLLVAGGVDSGVIAP